MFFFILAPPDNVIVYMLLVFDNTTFDALDRLTERTIYATISPGYSYLVFRILLTGQAILSDWDIIAD